MSAPSLEECLVACVPEKLARQITRSQDLARVAKKLSKWEEVRPWLDLSEADEDAIVRDHQSTDRRRVGLLEKWRERYGPNATYKELARAFHSAGRLDLVADVCEVVNTPSVDVHQEEQARTQDNLPGSVWTPTVDIDQRSHNLLQRKWVCLFVVLVAVFVLGLHWSGYIDLHAMKEAAYYNHYLHRSKSLPHLRTNFVGRDKEVRTIAGLLDFSHNRYRIVSIFGPPGFGKSALAIHVGHRMVSQGVTVYYVNMDEVSSLQTLAEKILTSDFGIVFLPNITTTRLEKWAKDLYSDTLLILDNCDSMLQMKGGGDSEKDALQKQLKLFLESAPTMKILLTSRKNIMQIDLRQYRLQELTAKSACDLLQKELSMVDVNTECSTIANLTGGVPLALKVVGTLLSQPDAPDLPTVIAGLETHLMSTLSPEDLPRDEQVNRSIAISYEYLNPQQQKVGRYLANFPGSFSVEYDICDLFSLVFQNCDCSCGRTQIKSLAKRSLLEHNTRTDRYQFHRLIKEFFLAVQKSVGKEGQKERERFAQYFYWHYSQYLNKLAAEFASDHVTVLKNLDAERHNFQFLLQYSAPNCPLSMLECLSSFAAIDNGLEQGLLQSRFTTKELYGPVKGVLGYFDRVTSKHITEVASPSHVRVYVSLLVTLTDFELKLRTVNRAIHTLEFRRQFIETLDEVIPGKGASVSYISYYSRLADLYKIHGDHDSVLDCHVKILVKTQELQKCLFITCDFCDIASSYYRLKIYETSVYFFKYCLDLPMSAVTRGGYLMDLLSAYRKLEDSINVQAMEQEFVDLFPSLMNESTVEFQKQPNAIHEVIGVYASLKCWDEVAALQKKFLMAAKELGIEVSLSNIFLAREIIELMYENESYANAADIGEFALNSLKKLMQEETEEVYVRLWVGVTYLVAKAHHQCGNQTESQDYFATIVDFTYDQYILTGQVESELIKTETWVSSCFYIPIHRIERCSKLLYGHTTAYLHWGVAWYLSIVTNPAFNTESDNHKQEPENILTRPMITSMSDSTSITVRHKTLANRFDHLYRLPLDVKDTVQSYSQQFQEMLSSYLFLFFQLVISFTIIQCCVNCCWICLKLCIPFVLLVTLCVRSLVALDYLASILNTIVYNCYNFLYCVYILLSIILKF